MQHKFTLSVLSFCGPLRIYLMSSVRQEVGQDYPTWSRGQWPDKSHLWSVSVGPLFFCSAVVVFLCFFPTTCGLPASFQAKAATERCGGGRGWGRAWPSRSSHPGMNSPGSGRQRSITQCSCGMTIYWVYDLNASLSRFPPKERKKSISGTIHRPLKICTITFFSDFRLRFHCLRHDLQEFQHPAVARHPLPRAGLALRLPAVQQPGSRGLPEDVPVCGLWPGAPPHRDRQLPGKTCHLPPRPKESEYPGEAKWTVLHR